jgi:transposase-like protein
VENWTPEEKQEIVRLSNYHGPNYKYICKPGHKKNVYYLLRHGQEIKILEWDINENKRSDPDKADPQRAESCGNIPLEGIPNPRG